MPSVRSPAPSTRRRAFQLAELGVYGFDRHQTTILAALVTEDPLLLVGRSGTGKTFLLNTLSEALGLEHRHYNASLISFDDLVGFPYPDDAHTAVRFLETPATVWGAESVLIDEISRCKPEHQNRLFSLVHERKLQGLPLKRPALPLGRDEPVHVRPGWHRGLLRLRSARSRARRPLRADRHRRGLERSHCRATTGDRRAVRRRASSRRATRHCAPRSTPGVRCSSSRSNACPQQVTTYVTTVVSALNGARIRISPRRARLLARSLVAATIVAGRATSTTFRSVLECSLPHPTWGQSVEPAVIAAAHRVAWDASREQAGAWIHAFLAEQSLPRKLDLLLDRCTDPDEGSQAIAQLIAIESPDRAAAFAFVTYPAALAGQLPIGAEGVNDLAKLAVPLLDAEGELSWQERLSEQGTSHPVIAEIGKVLAPLRDTRLARARQFLTACVVRGIALPSAATLEPQLHECVKLLRKHSLAGAEQDRDRLSRRCP